MANGHEKQLRYELEPWATSKR